MPTETIPRIELHLEGQPTKGTAFFRVVNARDSGNKAFHFLQGLTKRGAFDCKISAGPGRQHNAIRFDRAAGFEVYATLRGIEVVRV